MRPLLVFFVLAAWAAAEESYSSAPLDSVEGMPATIPWRLGEARVVLDGPGEAYLAGDFNLWMRGSVETAAVSVVARGPARRATVVVGDRRFSVDLAPAPEGAQAFRRAKAHHFRRLLQERVAGAAWFRHQVMETAGAIDLNDRDLMGRAQTTDIQRSFDFFTGGRAVSENLQLARAMPGGKEAEETVPLASLKGITVAEMDWTPHLEGVEPNPDPLAGHVPVDQYALFFPTFDAMITMIDAAAESGTPILHSIETQTEDARTKERYEKQLGLGTDALSRLFGPHLIRGVVFTGSDPFLREGTDVAVLFEAVDAAGLAKILHARRRAKSQGEPVEEVVGEVGGVAYDGLVSPGRVVSSYQATVKGAVVVTNSRVQLGRIVAASKGDAPSLGGLDEYGFFRHRYQRGAPDETGLLIIPDAAIRTWCGPRWRIAASRRVRAAAVLAGLEARHLDRLVAGGETAEPLEAPWPLVDMGTLEMGPRAVTSSVYNTRTFLTPIAEMEFASATEQEAEFYRRWRRGYESNWSNFFDPVAARFSVSEGRLAVDLTVMPLIVRSDYRTWIDVVKGARIPQGAGDPHEGALAHFVFAINKDNPWVKMGSGFLAVTGVAEPLGWLGESIAVYLDKDEVFGEALKAEDPEEFMEANVWRVPIGVHFEVGSAMKATLFLAGVRAWIEQSAPGMTEWTPLKHGEEDYVRVRPSAKARAEAREVEKLSVYYAIAGDRLVVTLSETLLKRALDRRTKARAVPVAGQSWPGDHLALKVDRGLLEMIERVFESDGFRDTLKKRSWSNLFILNEWKRRFPGKDPVALHERVFGTRLVCPGGGRYAWNGEWKTMESTAFGHPAAPKRGPEDILPFRGFERGSFGITFENDGLRARCELVPDTVDSAANR